MTDSFPMTETQPGVLPPPMPDLPRDTGLEFGFLADLTLKTVFSDTQCTSERVAEKLRLPMGIAEAVLQHLYKEKYIDIRKRENIHSNRYAMLDRGWEHAHRLLDVSNYIGPAPVSLEHYTSLVQMQEGLRAPADPAVVRQAFDHLVLPDSTLSLLGLVVDSRRSLFMSGPPGSGKTSIATALHAALQGDLWIPYAMEVDGQVIKVFDAHIHEPLEPPKERHDRRWLRIRRPMVIVGGEMTIESMDLIYSHTVRFYEAPFQLKSNGGILVIDDFGRQRMDPHDLLNRWIIPLETRIDYLTLHTGKKIRIPFEQTLIFATNLDVRDLVDEAFLRRMGYRLTTGAPDVATYQLVLERYLASRHLPYDSILLETLLARYKRENRAMKFCDPRDLVLRCLDICRYEGRTPEVTPELLERAWDNYFGSRPQRNAAERSEQESS